MPETGSCQGDPLSSYLFLLCAEAFSGLIQKAKVEGSIQGISVSRSAPSISHLLFADDTLIFCRATTKAMSCIRDILCLSERASGLKVHMQRSAMVISRNVTEDLRLELVRILGVVEVPRHEKYLGLLRSLDDRNESYLKALRTAYGVSYIIGRQRSSPKRVDQFF
ncbi:UNVERIFIED_CONTAM: hypothetical protein Slati_0776600 [Sesamum latifolium]|uniref:Reverse transcriptase domain-containing protein n=1 Tax=Sesamum latifolium TaxID=2727402 RepID=A0AAW2XKE0_9LAMI